MGFGLGVDRAADFRHPQADAVVREDGHGQAVLVAVEGALGLTDDDGVETAVRVGESVEKFGGLGPALPRQGAGQADVEEFGDDDAAGRFDEAGGAVALPVPRGYRVLLVLGGNAAVKREPLMFVVSEGGSRIFDARYVGGHEECLSGVVGCAPTVTREWGDRGRVAIRSTHTGIKGSSVCGLGGPLTIGR